MPTFAVNAAKSVTERNSNAGEGKILKLDRPLANMHAESPQKTLSLGPVVTQGGSPNKNGSPANSESKTNEANGLGILKQLTSNGTGGSNTASSTRTIKVGTWGKIPIVVRKARKPEENGKEMFKSSVPVMEQLQKKMKLSTVPKVVPLINTVGNQSKLIPLTFTAAAQASQNTPTNAVNSSVPNSQLKSGKKDTSKPMSILEATLTSSSKDPITNSNNLPKSKSLMLPSINLSVGSSVEHLSKHENSQEKGLNPIPVSTFAKKPKCVISYEKGVTRLVAVERRTVTMVDVSVQVSIPQLDTECQATQGTHNAVSSETGSIQPQTTSTLPLHQKPFVVLDSNGKKILAIPKQILGNYGGAKRFVIEGKGIKRKAESSIENLAKDDLNGTVILTPVTHSQAEQPPLTSSCSSNPVTSKTLPCSPADASLSFETLTTSSCQTLSSISAFPQSSCISSEANGSSKIENSTRTPTMLLSHSLNGGPVITSNSLVLPFNSPVQFESHHKMGSSLQKTLCVPTTSKVHTFQNNSDSIILPLNSPVGTEPLHTETSSVGVLPGCYVVMSNLTNSTNKEPDVLNHECGEFAHPRLMDLVEQVKASTRPQIRKPSLSSQPVQKAGQVVTNVVSNVIGNPIHTSNDLNYKNGASLGMANGGKTPSNSDGVSDVSSKNNIENYVKAALMDFKQCLTFDKNGQLPIHTAIESNNVAALKRQCFILKARKASIDIKNSKDESPLQMALCYGHTACVKVLLEHGANCRLFDQDGNSPLHLAILYADDAVKLLLASGQFTESYINCLNDEGFSALHMAAQYDKIEAISLLIKFGADIDLPDGKCGRTALFHAVERKKYKSQIILEKYGANMKEPTFTGTTPFSMTRSDPFAQLASGQSTFGEVIDPDTLLKPRRSRIGTVK